MIRFTEHAEESLRAREIEREAVLETISNPDSIVPDLTHSVRVVYMKRYFDNVLNREMLLRVIIEEADRVKTIITAYKTSQINRYLTTKSDQP
ncbi:MAG: DUF4258 domain-containing protein [Chloroherpetonaceae bacterium]